jgi:hypothetical protein
MKPTKVHSVDEMTKAYKTLTDVSVIHAWTMAKKNKNWWCVCVCVCVDC